MCATIQKVIIQLFMGTELLIEITKTAVYISVFSRLGKLIFFFYIFP